VQFMRGMVRVAQEIEADTQAGVLDAILKDLSNYSYAYLRLHAQNRRAFVGYVRDLHALGLGRSPLFWGYSAALLAVPATVLDRGIRLLKRVLPATPRFGGLYSGDSVQRS